MNSEQEKTSFRGRDQARVPGIVNHAVILLCILTTTQGDNIDDIDDFPMNEAAFAQEPPRAGFSPARLRNGTSHQIECTKQLTGRSTLPLRKLLSVFAGGAEL